MLVRILEVARIAAIEGVARRLHDLRAGLLHLAHDTVDFRLRADVMSDRELRRARRCGGKSSVVRDARPRPNRQLEPKLQLEERDRTVLELPANDAFALQTEPIAVEA